MNSQFWGFMLMTWVMCNVLAWLCGFDLSTKEKLWLANMTTLAIFLIGVAGILMGIE